MMNTKRRTACFIPYRKNEAGAWEFYLQMRDEKAPMYANEFGLFGGGVDENEDLRATVQRETSEELEYIPQSPAYFSKFEDSRAVYDVFIEEVGDDFEHLVTIHEGKFGQFLTKDAVLKSEVVAPHVIPIIDDLARMLDR